MQNFPSCRKLDILRVEKNGVEASVYQTLTQRWILLNIDSLEYKKRGVMTENILFICGTLNQTMQMHQIAQHMGEYNCYFTPFYTDGIERLIAKTGLLDFTVLGGRHQRETRQYFANHQLKVDERGEGREYDLVVNCSDLIMQNNIHGKRLVLVRGNAQKARSYHPTD